MDERGGEKDVKKKKRRRSNWNGAIKKRSVSIWKAKERSV